MKKRLRIILTLLLSVILLPASARHITIVISLDGCRWDYPQWYHTPFFDRMAQEGVASGLIPSYPSKTFPNHYTLATGLYPDHHGIVANDFSILRQDAASPWAPPTQKWILSSTVENQYG